jgi:adenylate cyclase
MSVTRSGSNERLSDRRKLLAVVYADMVGYSRLIGLDDLGTLERLRALRRNLIDPTIEEHGGRIVQTGGDSLLIVFDSIDGAVRCAVKVQQEVPVLDADEPPDRSIRFRIGVSIGDAIPDGTDLHGDAVNIVARLQAECPPGSICVSRSVRDHVHGRLGLEFEELGVLTLKNIARPVEAFLIKCCAGAITKPLAGSEVLPLPGKPSIAVLAFTNMSHDPEQEYFSDGIAEDITTALCRNRSLFVISRNSSFSYRGRALDVRKIAQELGVRYVLEGSVRRSADHLRVSAQLIEASTGANVWAERFDRAMTDMFAIQDEITEAVVNAIEPAMADAERQRAGRKALESLTTWELYHRGLWHLFHYSLPDYRLAVEFLHKAAALDPQSAAIQVGLALTYLFGGRTFAPQERATWLARTLEHGQMAVQLDAGDAMARAVFGRALLFSGDHDAAIRESALAVELNPSNATVQGYHAANLAYSGRSIESLPHFQQALRLSPVGQLRSRWLHLSAMAHYLGGDYETCVEMGRDLCRMEPTLIVGYRALLIGLAELGRIDEAHRFADIIYDRFYEEMRGFLTTRYLEFREIDYASLVASITKGGLVLCDGALTRVN